MNKAFLVIQHMPWEGPGRNLWKCFNKWNIRATIVEAWHAPIPDVTLYDGMICLGGAPNVDEEEKFPYLRPLKDQIKRCIETDRAYLGFCLGHQLLGHVLGAEVGPNPIKSIGFTEGLLTQEGREHPLFRGLPESIPLFKWHGQAVKLPIPEGFDCLMSSPHCAVEAISDRQRPHIIGLQCDNHAGSLDNAKEWIEGDRDWIHEGKGIDEEEILHDAKRLESLMASHFDMIFENFLNMLNH